MLPVVSASPASSSITRVMSRGSRRLVSTGGRTGSSGISWVWERRGGGHRGEPRMTGEWCSMILMTETPDKTRSVSVNPRGRWPAEGLGWWAHSTGERGGVSSESSFVNWIADFGSRTLTAPSPGDTKIRTGVLRWGREWANFLVKPL